MGALLALVRKDVVLYFSSKRALAVTLAAPILIAAFFGYVFGGRPTTASRLPVAIVDLDGTAVSKAIVDRMKGDASFEVHEATEPEAVRGVRDGKVRAAVVIPAGFAQTAPRAMFRAGAPKPQIVVHYDPSQSMVLPVVKGLLSEHVVNAVSKSVFAGDPGTGIVADFRKDVERSATIDADRKHDLLTLFDSIDRLQASDPAANRSPVQGLSLPFDIQQAEVTGRVDRRYNAYAHSFAGMGVQFVLFMGIEMGVGLLLMRRTGMWKRLRAAPVSRALLLGSRIVSGTLIAAVLMAGIYAAAIALFGVRIDGSVAGFVLVLVAFAILTSTFGLLIAAIGRTPEATRGLAILATLLLVMLGGAWVPTFVFPEWLQAMTRFVPTRWAIDGLDATTWRGLGLDAVWPAVVLMLACSAAFAWIATWRFSWEE